MDGFEKVKIVVKLPDEEKGEMPISVLHYPFGIPSETPKTKFEITSDKKGENFSVTRTEGEDGVKYVGHASTTSNRNKFVIGIYDEEKGEMTIRPILGNVPIRMDAMVPCCTYSASDVQFIEHPVDQNEIKVDKVETANLFGTRRNIRDLKSREELDEIKSNIKIKGQLSKKLEDISKQAEEDKFTTAQVLLSADENRNLPPYHLDATTGEEAYVFDELCPERFWPHLKIETWIQNQNLPPNTNKIEFLREYSHFAANMLSSSNASATTAPEMTEVKIVFIACLISIYKMKRARVSIETHDIMALEKQLYIKSIILEHYYNDFFTKKKLEVDKYWIMSTKSQRSLLLSYIVVMALLINNCEIDGKDLEILRRELNLDPKEFFSAFEVVGALVIKGKSKSNSNTYKVQLLLQKDKRYKIRTLNECLPKMSLPRRIRFKQ